VVEKIQMERGEKGGGGNVPRQCVLEKIAQQRRRGLKRED
jgi:hypothetical protein